MTVVQQIMEALADLDSKALLLLKTGPSPIICLSVSAYKKMLKETSSLSLAVGPSTSASANTVSSLFGYPIMVVPDGHVMNGLTPYSDSYVIGVDVASTNPIQEGPGLHTKTLTQQVTQHKEFVEEPLLDTIIHFTNKRGKL